MEAIDNPHFHRKLMMDELRKFEWDHLLDVGCASGMNLLQYRRAFPDKQLTGLDMNPFNMGTYVRRMGDIPLIVGDVRDLPFEDNDFDVITSDAVLMYAPGLKAINELKRVAKKAIIICEIHHAGNDLHHPEGKYQTQDYEKYGFKVVHKLDKWKGPPWEKHGYIMIWKK